MSEKFKVTIFKKTKGARYPEHIIVKRKSSPSDSLHPYDDTVHLYFDEGILKKFVHIQNAPKGKKIWNPKSERYEDLEPKHKIANEFIMEDGNITYLKEQTGNHFYSFGYGYPNERSIAFCNDQTHPGYFDYFRIRMDLNGKWHDPSDFDSFLNDMAAEITEVYTAYRAKNPRSQQGIKKSMTREGR